MISNEIINFINQTEEIFSFNNLENLKTIYHYSVPNVRLSYPEPFIASASFMHSDLWFVHILIYQYWLWFVFIFIIVFFFITFICTVRWCNMRIRPRKETRGVSRSKCGDLITACVPVTWATSIIVNESTDAIDYYDGFGTTELVVGIRAYQWGWEYYYPKDIDLNYNIKKNYSSFIGNSLKYNKTTELNLNSNNLWKYYQNKNFDQVILPAYLLVLPVDNKKLLNFLNFNDIGSNTLYEINAFKKIRMFSKVYTSDLFFINSNFSYKYKYLSNLYLSNNNFSDSYLYGTKRQHNFLSSFSYFSNQFTFLNNPSVRKLFSFNFQNNFFSLNNNSNFLNLNYFYKNNLNLNINLINIIGYIDKNKTLTEQFSLSNFIFYNNFLNKINDNTDKKKLIYPIQKLFNLNFKKNYFFEKNNFSNYTKISDLFFFKNSNEVNNFFNNKNLTFKTTSLFSSNQSISLGNKNIRNFVNLPINSSNLNYSLNLNTVVDYLSLTKNKFDLNNFLFFNLNNLNWVDLQTQSKLSSNKTLFDYPYSPIFSNNLLITPFNYDSHKHTFVENTPTILQGKEELMPFFLPNIYWNFYWSNTNIDWRFYNNNILNLISKKFYFPIFTFYYDYDFRNWQSFELLEDSYWESVYSIYTYDEYLSLVKDFSNYDYFGKEEKFFNIFNKLLKKNSNGATLFLKPINKSGFVYGDFYSNSFYLDDSLNNVKNLPTKDFFIYPLIYSFINNEESYESLKNLVYYFNNNNLFFFNTSVNYFYPLSYSTVFDSFRSDFDEFSWFFDDSFFNKDFFFLNDFFTFYFKSNKNLNYFFSNNNFNLNFNYDNNKKNRFSNSINLRNTAKNSIVNFNAIQKVFRTRFDENRSHARINDLSGFYIKQPFISSSRTPYEKTLGKNKENFFKPLLYKNNFKNFLNNLYFSNSSLNFYFFDFPFLMALKSDASRYLWFDWYSKWGFYEVQPSSSSRYAIHGMPYFSKNFEYSGSNNENLNETETYLVRISKARKNYLPNWAYTPYFYAKNNLWYKNNILFNAIDQLNYKSNSLTLTKYLLHINNWYWNDLFFSDLHFKRFFPSNSNVNTYSKTNWKPQNSIQSYYYSISNLIDILTKREFLLRELFLKKNKIVSVPFYLTNSPKNPIIDEVKSNFLFIDSIVQNNEYSRNFHYSSLNFFNFVILKNFINEINLSFGFTSISNYIFFYFFNNNLSDLKNFNTELLKNQYRPLKKGITNMIRLHATGAMALPIEIRLQILASSKDVIHSWAIPSAGIKIDCIPGYSSHRVMIFLVSGIFWGQCMEICGRYHHWMPIIVYFMKRDLFFLWCTHFIFLSGSNNQWNINDRQYSDYIRLASFDKLSWLTEIQK